MTKELKLLAYRSLLGMYAATIIEEYQTEELKKEWWYKNAYRIYKKCKGMKKARLKTKEANILRDKLKQITELEEKHFVNDEWNPYALTIITLEYMVNELNFIEFKSLLLDIKPLDDLTMLEKSETYKELQKHCYRYFTDVIKIIEG